ncbi:MAG: type II secretion system F family protein [Planctomycetes bacterium]|nr:type II secretion system F family protein [Planctomycetota bacterium]
MRFRSTILEPDGSTVTAELEAADEQALHGALAAEGRALLRVKPLEVVGGPTKPVDVRLAPKRLLLLTQALHEALDAGVPLLGTFEAVAEQEEDDRVAAMLEDLGSRVAAGQTLADSLAAYPRAFNGVYCALVRVGEQSGSLPEVLESVAGFIEWRIEIAGTVKQAMIYPAVVAVAGYSMVLFLLSFVIPRLGEVLSKIGNELPAASRVLIDASGFVAHNILWIALGSIGSVVGFLLLMRTAPFQRAVMNLLGSLPVVRNVMRTLAIAQFARTFGVMLRAGLTMTSALQMGADSVSLPRLRDSIDRAGQRILGGARLGEALDEEQVLPPVAMSMVKVGEEAGRLPITFERLGRLYDREVKTAVKKALALMEPAVTVLLGLVVGGVAVLVVMTIYSAMKGIGK